MTMATTMIDGFVIHEADEHTHECRDCRAEIVCCFTEDECQWAGGNDDCECATESVTMTYDDTVTDFAEGEPALPWVIVSVSQVGPERGQAYNVGRYPTRRAAEAAMVDLSALPSVAAGDVTLDLFDSTARIGA